MKKLLTSLTACTMILFSLCSCSKETESESSSISESTSTTAETTTMQKNDAKLDDEIIQPIINYFEGFNTKNPELISKSFTPQIYIDAMKENNSYEDYINSLENDIENTYNDLWIPKCGENTKLLFGEEISNSTMSEESLRNAEKYFDYTYYDLNGEVEIEEGYELTYNYTMSGDDDSIETTEVTCIVKIKNEGWMPIFCPVSTLDYYKDAPDIGEDETTSNAE